MNSNKRKLNLLFFLAACIFVSVAATKPSHVKTETKNLSQSDTGLFKNLKVLPKDISKDSLDKVMHQFTAALAVRCNFCHVFNNGKMDFVTDEKPEKDIARHMLTMTSEINAKYFNWEQSTRPDTISVIKCVTCHHGNPHPDEAANMMGNQMQQQPGMPPHDTSGKMPPPPAPHQ